MRSIDLGGYAVPVIGQGTWHMGEDLSQRQQEIAALRYGIELGATLIDTAEMYGEGGAEKIVGAAIDGQRDKVFLVSKVYPHNAGRQSAVEACERSLRRLGTDMLDLYLLHWRGQYPLAETVEAFQRLQEQGKIRRWGVSNLGLSDLHELDDDACATNQVLYNLEERGIEFDLLPWMQQRQLPLMAYCPIAQAGDLLHHSALRQVAERHNATAAQICLAWVLRQDGVLAIPKAVSQQHLAENVAAAALRLDAQDLHMLDAAFPAPLKAQALAMV